MNHSHFSGAISAMRGKKVRYRPPPLHPAGLAPLIPEQALQQQTRRSRHAILREQPKLQRRLNRSMISE
jgi:hypothetical protein